MNVLILGGNGYIGSKVTREILNAGHSVVCTKRLSSNLYRIDDIVDKIKWISSSVEGVESECQNTQFDYVLNLACNYGLGNFLYDGILSANIIFPLQVLNIVVARGTKKFLTIGTGLPDEFNMYSFTKKMLTEFGRFYVEKHSITFSSLLLEMFYGADEPRNRFLPSIIEKMINGDVVETTLGTQKRDIIAADDIVKAIMMVFNSNIEGFHEIPVGTGVSPSVSEIVDFIWEETAKKSRVFKGAIPMRNNEPDCVSDNSVLKSIGEWNPTPWREGLIKMIKKMEEAK